MFSFITTEEAARASGCAIVVDVMRAFTVSAWAFHLGASRIVLVREVDEALDLKRKTPGALAFQDGRPLPGFDLANSPVRIERLDLVGRTIFQRTSAGTKGAIAASRCAPLVCTGFASANATAEFLRRERVSECSFVITGENGRATEDIACAEYIAERVRDPNISASPFVEAARGSRAAAKLHEAVAKGYEGVDPDDVERCLEVGRFDFVICGSLEDGALTLRRRAV